MTRRQCAKCPWKVSTNPHEIPGGYSVSLHQRLRKTIAEPGDLPLRTLNIMSCHESPVGSEIPCVGWLANQLGPGNNLALRFAVHEGRISADVETVGKQHSCFEDTLPKGSPCT